MNRSRQASGLLHLKLWHTRIIYTGLKTCTGNRGVKRNFVFLFLDISLQNSEFRDSEPGLDTIVILYLQTTTIFLRLMTVISSTENVYHFAYYWRRSSVNTGCGTAIGPLFLSFSLRLVVKLDIYDLYPFLLTVYLSL